MPLTSIEMERVVGEILLEWYADNKRNLPWRQTDDPYRIWISEVILQQTRVVQGEAYFNRFVERFPTVKALAEADTDQVMLYWQGLGYYSRAQNLHRAAQQIMERFDGRFPVRYEDVTALQGIGPYTAAAICSIAYNQPYAVVDGNVYRVLSRLFGVDLPIDSTVGKRYFAQLADSLLDRTLPGEYNQAMMDFGALQCVPKSPDCRNCPLADRCIAYFKREVAAYPVKAKKTDVKSRYFNYIRMRCHGKTLLRKREAKDIWQRLYEFPMIETDRAVGIDELRATEDFQNLVAGADGLEFTRSVEMKKHQLSHQTIYAVFYEFDCVRLPDCAACEVVQEERMGEYAVCRLIENYLTRFFDE